MKVAYSVSKLKDFSPAALDKAVEKLLSALEQESKAVENESAWKAFRDRWMARKNGVLAQTNELLKAAPKEAKREVGLRVNEVKIRVEEAVREAKTRYEDLAILGYAGADKSETRRTAQRMPLDISLPGIRRPIGAEHPIIR